MSYQDPCITSDTMEYLLFLAGVPRHKTASPDLSMLTVNQCFASTLAALNELKSSRGDPARRRQLIGKCSLSFDKDSDGKDSHLEAFLAELDSCHDPQTPFVENVVFHPVQTSSPLVTGMYMLQLNPAKMRVLGMLKSNTLLLAQHGVILKILCSPENYLAFQEGRYCGTVIPISEYRALVEQMRMSVAAPAPAPAMAAAAIPSSSHGYSGKFSQNQIDDMSNKMVRYFVSSNPSKNKIFYQKSTAGVIMEEFFLSTFSGFEKDKNFPPNFFLKLYISPSQIDYQFQQRFGSAWRKNPNLNEIFNILVKCKILSAT